jgi:hypothetical protein
MNKRMKRENFPGESELDARIKLAEDHYNICLERYNEALKTRDQLRINTEVGPLNVAKANLDSLLNGLKLIQ